MPQAFEQLGPYKLGKKIGQGGMGAVFAGVDTETGQPVAVKVLAAAMAAEEGFRGRFEAEIESLKKLRHPNIVRLFGYGEQRGTMFYAMELVEGTSLEEEIRQGRRFEWREVTQIAVKMCKALKLAHDHGIIHRDIKPANILMSRDGEVKLSDFGIARLFGNTRMTSDGGVLGTAEYMAPEQADGRPVNDRCDQYSLGGVMYALLAGRPPFRASSFVEMLQMQRFTEAQPVRRYAPDTPAELDRIIAQLLEKEPAKRFVNTLMLARALEAMEKGLSLTSHRDDFVISDSNPSRTPHLTGLNPFAATMVPKGDSDAEEGYAIAPEPDRTLAHAGKTSSERASPTEIELTTRFTKVRERDEEKATWYREAAQAFFSPQSLALLIMLVVVLGVAWYVLKPGTADQLYERAKATVDDGRLANVRSAEPTIDEFMNRFPDDPRVAELDEYKSQLLVARRARNAKLSARTLKKLDDQSPIEKCYVEASALAAINPEAAIAKLQAIIDLYGDAPVTDADGGEFLEIAKQDLSKLKQQVNASSSEQLQLVKTQAERAKTREKDDPAGAKRIWQSILELYGDKPWAAEVVESARQSLAELAKAPESLIPADR